MKCTLFFSRSLSPASYICNLAITPIELRQKYNRQLFRCHLFLCAVPASEGRGWDIHLVPCDVNGAFVWSKAISLNSSSKTGGFYAECRKGN